jgi:hypothetical protein
MLRYTFSFPAAIKIKHYVILLATLFFFSSGNALAQGRCYPKWYIGSNIYGGHHDCTCAQTTVDTLLDGDDGLWITLSSQLACSGDCSLEQPETYAWIHNSDTVESVNYLVEDTGTYIGIIKYSGCGPGTMRIRIHVGYNSPAAITELNKPELLIYPSISSGVFKIKSEHPLAKILIRDCSGKVVFSTYESAASIDITYLIDGIYFYYIEDKKQHAKSGKLVKR